MARLRIFVAGNGNPDWPRYALQDNKGRYWDGRWWATDLRAARLHHREQEAADEATTLNDSIEPRWFIASVTIMVEHDERFTIEQLQDLLEQSSVLLDLPDQHDMEGVDVEINLDLGGMEETG